MPAALSVKKAKKAAKQRAAAEANAKRAEEFMAAKEGRPVKKRKGEGSDSEDAAEDAAHDALEAAVAAGSAAAAADLDALRGQLGALEQARGEAGAAAAAVEALGARVGALEGRAADAEERLAAAAADGELARGVRALEAEVAGLRDGVGAAQKDAAAAGKRAGEAAQKADDLPAQLALTFEGIHRDLESAGKTVRELKEWRTGAEKALKVVRDVAGLPAKVKELAGLPAKVKKLAEDVETLPRAIEINKLTVSMQKELKERVTLLEEGLKEGLNENFRKVSGIMDDMVARKVDEAVVALGHSPRKPRPGKSPSKPFLTRSDTVDAELPDN